MGSGRACLSAVLSIASYGPLSAPAWRGWRDAITPATKLLFAETPSNPLSELGDIKALAALAHENDAWLAIDNCFCTPALQRPLELGADIVVHSATKYLDGQGRCVGGVALGEARHMDEVQTFLRTCGPTMSAFNAWVFLKGLETLRLRMEAHSANALALARWLREQPLVEQVYYSGLEDHPGHALAARPPGMQQALLHAQVTAVGARVCVRRRITCACLRASAQKRRRSHLAGC